MGQAKGSTQDFRPEDSPVAWFVMLERARITNDVTAAVNALNQLHRLGVKVTYRQDNLRPDRSPRRAPEQGVAVGAA